MNRHGLTVLLSTLLALAAGCSSNGRATEDLVATDGRWLQPAPILQQQLDDEAERLPWTHGFERIEQVRWFASIGEPAYATLLELASDPREDVAAAALSALGATLDNRLVPAIKELDLPREATNDLGLERARTLVRLGDWSQVPVLIAGLRDERVYTRSLCVDALRKATHESHGYDPRASETQRENAILRWEQWWLARGGEGILSGS